MNGSFIPGSNVWSAQWPQACSAGQISEPIEFEDVGEAFIALIIEVFRIEMVTCILNSFTLIDAVFFLV